jgi:hypothetical protein
MRIVIAAQNYLPNLNGAAVFATNLAEGLELNSTMFEYRGFELFH